MSRDKNINDSEKIFIGSILLFAVMILFSVIEYLIERFL